MRCGREFEQNRTLIQCPICGGSGTEGKGQKGEPIPCQHCRKGEIHIDRCPREMIGGEMTEAVNIAGMCGNGDWPVNGGLMSQAAWFLDLKQTLDSDVNAIQNEKLKD